MSSKHKLFQVDAFTDITFKGNPAGVCILSTEVSPEWMQAILQEMNLSETAFVRKTPSTFIIRFFTPKVEVPLCGHATLASAHILYELGIENETDTIRFDSKSGDLHAFRDTDWIRMEFPRDRLKEVEAPALLHEVIDTEIGNVFRSCFGWYLVELPSEEVVRKIKPNLYIMKCRTIGPVLVTARSDDAHYDFVSRFFTPSVGIDEDPVTGSAHCTLGPYWAQKLGKTDLIGHQVSEREGIIRVLVKEKGVLISGKAITIFRIDITV